MKTTEITEFTENKYPYSKITNKIIKCAIEVHKAQILSYLKATRKRIGLLINFAKTKIEIKRTIL